MFMASTNSDVRRNIQRWIRTEADFIKAEALILGLKARFLKVLLNCRGKWQIENGNLKPLLTGIVVGFQHADLDLQRLWLDFFIRNSSAFFIWNSSDFCDWTSLEKSLIMPTNMDGLVSGMQKRLKRLQAGIDEVYTVLSKSPGCDTDMIDEATEAGRIQEVLEGVWNRMTILKCVTPGFYYWRADFLYSRHRFEESQSQLLHLSEKLEIRTCFEDDIEALFYGGLFFNHDFWLLGNRTASKFKSFLEEMEAWRREKMTDDNAAGPLEDETRLGKTSVVL